MINRFTTALFALTPLLCGGISPAADSAPSEGAECLEKIYAALEARQTQQLDVFLIDYTDKEFWSARALEAMHANDREYNSGVTFSDQSFEEVLELARKGQMVRRSRKGAELGYAAAAAMKLPIISVYDGKILKNYENQSRSYSVSVNPDRAIRDWDPWQVCGEKDLYEFLKDWHDNKGNGKFGRLKKIICRDGHLPSGDPLTYLELVNENKYSWKVWLLPNLGYCVHQLEEWTDQGRIARRHHGCRYREVNGVPYPVSATCTSFFDGKESSVAMESRIEVRSVETDPQKIPDEIFKMDIPLNASVKDLDTGGKLVSPQNVQAHIDQMIEALPGNKTRVWLWLGAGLILVGAAVAGFLSSRRYRRRIRSAPEV